MEYWISDSHWHCVPFSLQPERGRRKRGRAKKMMISDDEEDEESDGMVA